MGEENKTYTVFDVIIYTIDILKTIRLPISEIDAIKGILSAISNLSECADAINTKNSQNATTEENEVVEDV